MCQSDSGIIKKNDNVELTLEKICPNLLKSLTIFLNHFFTI